MPKIKKIFASQVFNNLLILSSLYLLIPDTAEAGYLDPGSGSTLAQGIIAIVAGIRRFFGKIFGIFSRGGK